MTDVVDGSTLFDLLGTANEELASSSSQAYLSYLTTLPLQNLLSEPSLLQTQSHHLTSSLTSLTHTSYPTFLSLHETTKAFSDSLDTLSASLNTVVTDSLPALEESASNWKERTDSVLGERKKARVVLEQHDKIRDLLDIPLLIDNCVRNGFFAEALSLASHANTLYASSKTPPLILTSIISEVRASVTQMLFSLLATLHEPSRKLPALWKAVNFLRKMDVFDLVHGVHPEEQLALAFITGRETCLQGSLEGRKHDIERLVGTSQRDLGERDREDLVKTFKSYIEIWREGVHDIITQYTTIFLERSGSSLLPSPHIQGALQALITTYASHALHRHLIPLLDTTLPHIPLSSLSPFLNQLTYCATAFGRIGLDFRGFIGDLFSRTILNSVRREIEDSTAIFVEQLKQKTGRPTSSQVRNSTPPSAWAIVSSAISSPPISVPPNLSKELDVPPRVLSSYPPLARYMNALLTTFNSFRQLSPTALASPLQGVLEDEISEAGEALLRYLKNVVGQSELEGRIAEALGTVYFHTFVPYARAALGAGIYGVETDYQMVEEESDLGRTVREWEGWSSTIRGST